MPPQDTIPKMHCSNYSRHRRPYCQGRLQWPWLSPAKPMFDPLDRLTRLNKQTLYTVHQTSFGLHCLTGHTSHSLSLSLSNLLRRHTHPVLTLELAADTGKPFGAAFGGITAGTMLRLHDLVDSSLVGHTWFLLSCRVSFFCRPLPGSPLRSSLRRLRRWRYRYTRCISLLLIALGQPTPWSPVPQP